MLMDGGANVECRPEMLYQFAVMGSIYMEKVMGIKNPRVGLANVGAEEHKGTELYRNTHELLQNSKLNFIGNVEGRDIPNGVCDVVVCDGFTGNLILKTYEGVALVMMNQIKNMFMGSVKGKLAAGLVMKDLKNMKTHLITTDTAVRLFSVHQSRCLKHTEVPRLLQLRMLSDFLLNM